MKGQIDKIAEGLKNNFLFQASLGSKELFHSNILAWILEQQNKVGEFEALRHFLKEVANLDVGIITEDNNPIIAREENKIDLTIRWKEGDNWNLIFIENKMKSIPTPKQLNEYDGKIDVLWDKNTESWPPDKWVRKKFILTPFPSKVQSNSQIMHWENITYSKEIINDFLPKINDFEFANAEQTDIKIVLEKYLSFLKVQNDILKYLKLNDSEKFKKRHYDFYSKHAAENEDESEDVKEELSESMGNHYMSVVRSLRLHDLVLKLAHSKLANLIEEEIKHHNDLLENYHYHSNFTNSEGLTEVGTTLYEDKIKKKHINIGIQLQGNQFRYYLSSSSNIKDLNIKLAEELLKDGIWFNDVKTKKRLLGKGRSKREKVQDSEGALRSFCEYSSGGFLYFYQDVYQDDYVPTIDEIIQMFVSAFKHYEDIKSKIQKCLVDILER